ncbi:MAG TPA: murein biosynthesis integral membrane protein MurJ [Gemmatimonadales bacterium]|nr:murein biosynthesis integral membrane protein MurJ [Gemmatimonadales bacterium]
MSAPDPAPPSGKPRRSGGAAFFVALGILLSRLIGLIRQRIFAKYLGLSDAADVYTVAFRIPNFLQNLFGEGALSASFIPVYAGLLAQGRRDEARRVAGAVVTILGFVVALIVLAGVLGTPQLMSVIAPGYTGAKRELGITLVRIFFPGAGLLVLSAWCLGVLNSHRSFLVPYAAPVMWNLAIIFALIWQGPNGVPEQIAIWAAWGSVIGSGLQLLVQLPLVRLLAGSMGPGLGRGNAEVRSVVGNFLPAFISRGVTQISAYVDSIIATLLPTGAAAALGSAQMIYTLPVSLFGMSVSAAELPAMSGAVGSAEEVAAHLRRRLDAGLRRIAFLVVPSAMAFLTLGGVIAAALFQSGHFTAEDSRYVWGILAGSAVGLLAGTLGRLYASASYALRDTRTPLAFAIIRVLLTVALGLGAALWLPHLVGVEDRWGAAGLTASAGVAGWVEFVLLRLAINRRIGRTGIPFTYLVRLWSAALVAAGVAWGVRWLLGPFSPIPQAILVLGVYGVSYLALALLFGVSEVSEVTGRVSSIIRRQ